ncbi:MAG: deoxyribodipyrimidine photolyase-related protein [Puniceicoccaceae bacterium 5H]|nr:MAG: deoxyribodipyrimidine photolyase-related protein [Puniceicoccaceae bacterium 5H]
MPTTRRLYLVLGDQLDHRSALWEDFDPRQDAVWMAENETEATHVWCHQLRLAFFFSAMRHFRDELRAKGHPVHYHALTARRSDDRGQDVAEILRQDVHRLQPERLVVVEPGDERVRRMLQGAAVELGLALEIRPDTHFYASVDDFKDWAQGRNSLLLETWYRHLRRREGILMQGKQPEGGDWNYDADNRATFGREGPEYIKPPRQFTPDATTREVLEMVAQRFGDHPGRLDHFHLPVNREQALQALREFVDRRLELFGRFQDAMWQGEDFLYHSRLSAALNIKLLHPREVIEKVLTAYAGGDAPLNSVEGFVRQILGWREFVRGIYWTHMPEYAEMNALGAQEAVPPFFWDGETQMACVRDAMRNVLDNAYAHHIQRLMVLGLFALLYGVHPRKFHEWHMAMYADAIDWVSLPNALGMSQHGAGGIVGTKPYCATGNYIHKMSNHCDRCRYQYKQATGEQACPMTTLYYDFLDRHRDTFKDNQRMAFQLKNLQRKSADELKQIRARAHAIRQHPERY